MYQHTHGTHAASPDTYVEQTYRAWLVQTYRRLGTQASNGFHDSTLLYNGRVAVFRLLSHFPECIHPPLLYKNSADIHPSQGQKETASTLSKTHLLVQTHKQHRSLLFLKEVFGSHNKHLGTHIIRSAFLYDSCDLPAVVTARAIFQREYISLHTAPPSTCSHETPNQDKCTRLRQTQLRSTPHHPDILLEGHMGTLSDPPQTTRLPPNINSIADRIETPRDGVKKTRDCSALLLGCADAKTLPLQVSRARLAPQRFASWIRQPLLAPDAGGPRTSA